MKEIIKYLLRQLSSAYFWEDGHVMIAVSLIISIMIELLLCKAATVSQKNWLLFMPAILCSISIVFGVIMLLFPNGTGGVTQHFYLGITVYSFAILVISVLLGILVFFLKKIKK